VVFNRDLLVVLWWIVNVYIIGAGFWRFVILESGWCFLIEDHWGTPE
jgi:hypothetical protein